LPRSLLLGLRPLMLRRLCKIEHKGSWRPARQRGACGLHLWTELKCSARRAFKEPLSCCDGARHASRRMADCADHGVADHPPAPGSRLLRRGGGAATLFIATAFGVPVSTTHTITGAIVGVGAARKVAAVRWNVASDVVIAVLQARWSGFNDVQRDSTAQALLGTNCRLAEASYIVFMCSGVCSHG
jgi:hypothetical protein